MTRARGGPRAPRIGVVERVRRPRGLGAVLDDDGRRYRFHCTAVADGTRHVEVGARVVFSVVRRAPGPLRGACRDGHRSAA